jgi:hypothetical protein
VKARRYRLVRNASVQLRSCPVGARLPWETAAGTQRDWRIYVEIAAVMVVGALVGRAGRHMLEGGLLEDGFVATLVGVLGAMVTAIAAHAVVGPLSLGAIMLVAAVGTMAFFSLFLATFDRAADRQRR